MSERTRAHALPRTPALLPPLTPPPPLPPRTPSCILTLTHSHAPPCPSNPHPHPPPHPTHRYYRFLPDGGGTFLYRTTPEPLARAWRSLHAPCRRQRDEEQVYTGRFKLLVSAPVAVREGGARSCARPGRPALAAACSRSPPPRSPPLTPPPPPMTAG